MSTTYVSVKMMLEANKMQTTSANIHDNTFFCLISQALIFSFTNVS